MYLRCGKIFNDYFITFTSDSASEKKFDEKFSCRWQTARRVCPNAVVWLTTPLPHAPPHMCHHVEFGRCVLKDVGISGRWWTAENVTLLVTPCSVRLVRHRHISQYLKFQGVLECRPSVGLINHDLFRATHTQRKRVPIRLLVYSWRV